MIEVLLVIVILGVIAAVAVTQLDIRETTDKAKRDATEVTIGQLVTAVERYYLDMGSYPSSLEQLVTDPGSSDWGGPYQKKLPTDRWGDAFVYTQSGRSFEISSNAGGSEGGSISSNELY